MRVSPWLLGAGLAGLGSLPAAGKPPAPVGTVPREVNAPSGQGVSEQDPSNDMDEEQDRLAPIAPAEDSLGRHFVASGSAGLVIPFGELHDGLPQAKVVAAGPGVGFDLAYGVSRTAAVGAWAQLAILGSGSECADCSATSVGVGPLLRYHLVQGVRFDPWLSAGFGYQSLNVEVGSVRLRYQGWTLLRLLLGGDWYAFRHVGFGPFLQLDSGWYAKQPERAAGPEPARGNEGNAPFFAFSIGAHAVFDTPGK
jgi:hypothetical protein